MAVAAGGHGAGDFIASAGVEPLDWRVSRRGIRLRLDPATHDLGWSVGGTNATKYRTFCIGDGGRVRKVDTTLTPFCPIAPGDRYTRPLIVDSDNRRAWGQPAFRT